MKKLLLTSLLLLSGCSCICPNTPVRAISNEKNTNIFYNQEYIGADSTYVLLRNKGIDKAKLVGEKKGCQTTVLPVEYRFNWGVLNIVDLRNIGRLLTWDVYEADPSKDLYNLTPKCN